VLEDEHRRNRIGRMGLDRRLREFDLSRAAARLSQYYEWLLCMPSVSGACAEPGQVRTL
jgi:hypothetical protein